MSEWVMFSHRRFPEEVLVGPESQPRERGVGKVKRCTEAHRHVTQRWCTRSQWEEAIARLTSQWAHRISSLKAQMSVRCVCVRERERE